MAGVTTFDERQRVKNFKSPMKKDVFGKAAFDIEHALDMYALSFCTIPAESIYDGVALASLKGTLEKCHIYLIGYTPKIEFIEAEQKGKHLLLTFQTLADKHVLDYELSDGLSLKSDGDLYYLRPANTTGPRTGNR